VAKSPKPKLTQAMCEGAKVPKGKSQYVLWDGTVTGLGLRCLPGGAKTWVYVYRGGAGGRKSVSQTLRLGSWPEVTADAARKAARAHAGAVAHGRDPAAERREERRREKATLRIALDDYERSLLQRRLVNVGSTMSTLRRGLSALMAEDVRTLTRSNYVEAVAVIERGGRLGAAGDLRKHCRTFAEWCVGRGLADYNPLAGLRRPRRTRAERLEAAERGRALDDTEIRRVWQAAGGLGSFGGLVQLALLTGMRRGELSGLRWSDVKSDRIVLEAQHTKTGTAHEVPLTDLMREVLAQQPRTSSKLVFPSSRTNGRILGWTKLVNRLVAISGVDLTMHDMRRTCRTLMSRLEVPEDIAELAIGHQRADLIARYNLDHAWARRVEAFERLSRHLAGVVHRGKTQGEANVVPYRRKSSAKSKSL
jgi:integrase